MLGPIVTERSKRAPMSKGGTEKDQKVAMSRVGKSDKIPAVHPSQIQHHREGEDGLHDERPQEAGVKRP